MKKVARIILWSFFVLFLICTVAAVFASSGAHGATSDLILERVSNVLLFAGIDFGLFVELNLFGLKKKLPLIKKRKPGAHILFWALLLTLSVALSYTADHLTSAAFREEKKAITQAAEEERTAEQQQKEAARALEKQQKEAARALEKQQKEAARALEKQQKEAARALEKQKKEKETTTLPAPTTDPKEKAETTKKAEPEKTTAPERLTWETLQKTPERYKEVLSLICENRNAGAINEALSAGLSKEEQALALEVFASGDKVPKELAKSFTAFCKENGYAFPEMTETDFYQRVSKGFRIGWSYRKKECSLSCYSIPEEDYTEDRRYLDAERYVDAGCILYTCQNGNYVEYAQVLDVKYGIVTDNTCYGFAIKLRYLDPEMIDPAYDETAYYMDGDLLFNLPRETQGKPGYFVAATDLHRTPEPNRNNYLSYWKWQPLSGYHGDLDGKDVYMGMGSCKTLQFTVTAHSSRANTMTVLYPSGNAEVKSYWAMVNNKALYVIDR